MFSLTHMHTHTHKQRAFVANQPPPPQGEVTARFNLKPLAHRWATDICAALPLTPARQRQTAEEPDNLFATPPVPRIRSRRSPAGPIVITDAENSQDPAPTPGRSGPRLVNTPPNASIRKLQRNFDSLKADKESLKKANAKLQREVGTLNSKLDRSQTSLTTALSEQAAMKERLKTTTTEGKIMREMITTYHTKVMSELTKIRQDVETIRSTPVEIVATHERAGTPMMTKLTR